MEHDLYFFYCISVELRTNSHTVQGTAVLEHLKSPICACAGNCSSTIGRPLALQYQHIVVVST